MSETAPGLIVDSVTGIDVSLPVAGAGARSYAFLVDWHIRAILALSWYTLGAFLYNGHFSLVPPLTNEARWFGAVVAPALAVYFLYHLVVEIAMRGSTPGKRTAGVRIVARDGGAPSIGALMVRNVFRLIDSLPVFYGAGLLVVVLTRDHVRCGDMAGGTLLVYERVPARLPVAQGALSAGGRLGPAAAEIVLELLERWPTLEPQARARLAQQLLARYGDAAPCADDENALRARLEQLARPA